MASLQPPTCELLPTQLNTSRAGPTSARAHWPSKAHLAGNSELRTSTTSTLKPNLSPKASNLEDYLAQSGDFRKRALATSDRTPTSLSLPRTPNHASHPAWPFVPRRNKWASRKASDAMGYKSRLQHRHHRFGSSTRATWRFAGWF